LIVDDHEVSRAALRAGYAPKESMSPICGPHTR
jgi:hypothetical protein